MLSHDFARLLLSRRDNDMLFSVEVALPGADEGEFYRVKMEDDRQREVYGKAEILLGDLVRYDPEADAPEIKLATIFLGEGL